MGQAMPRDLLCDSRELAKCPLENVRRLIARTSACRVPRFRRGGGVPWSKGLPCGECALAFGLTVLPMATAIRHIRDAI